ncbi:hypothetical protein H8959_003845 [Pygathrix nigripes]
MPSGLNTHGNANKLLFWYFGLPGSDLYKEKEQGMNRPRKAPHQLTHGNSPALQDAPGIRPPPSQAVPSYLPEVQGSAHFRNSEATAGNTWLQPIVSVPGIVTSDLGANQRQWDAPNARATKERGCPTERGDTERSFPCLLRRQK